MGEIRRPGDAYIPPIDGVAYVHLPHRRPLTDWESLYRAEVSAKDEWKSKYQKHLESSHVFQLASAEHAEKLTKENESLKATNHLSLVSLNGQEKRHKEEVAKLNANYLQVMVERDQLQASQKSHHEEADKLQRQNEELSRASYQLNAIKEALRFLSER